MPQSPRRRAVTRALAMIQGGGLGRFLSALGPTAVSLGLQFITFAVTARGLGVEAFGDYAAVLALAAISVELVGLGGADLLVRAVARDPSRFPTFLGNMLTLIGLTLPIVLIVGLWFAVGPMQSRIAPIYLLLALGGEIVAARSAASAELVMVAFSHTFRASCVRMVVAGSRLAVAVAYFAAAKALDGWIVWVLAQSLLLSGALWATVAWRYGRPQGGVLRGEIPAGAAFALNQTARATQGNVDRLILSRLAEPAVLGPYAAGTRILVIGLFPIQVMTRLFYPNFFRHGENGLAATRRYAISKVPAMLGTGLMASVAVAAAAQLIPTLLGADFAASRHVAVLLGLSLPLIAMQYLAADTLTGAGYQHVRAIVYAGSALGFGLLLAGGAWIGGVNGLITAYLGAHAAMMILLWVIAFTLADERKTS